MSRTYQTDKEPVIAKRNLWRHKDGSPVLPRIIERKPFPGCASDGESFPSRLGGKAA